MGSTSLSLMDSQALWMFARHGLHCSSFLCDTHFPSTELSFSLEFSPLPIYPLQSFRKLQSLLSGGEGDVRAVFPPRPLFPKINDNLNKEIFH